MVCDIIFDIKWHGMNLHPVHVAQIYSLVELIQACLLVLHHLNLPVTLVRFRLATLLKGYVDLGQT